MAPILIALLLVGSAVAHMGYSLSYIDENVKKCMDDSKAQKWWTIDHFEFSASVDSYNAPDASARFKSSRTAGFVNFTLTHPSVPQKAYCTENISENLPSYSRKTFDDFTRGRTIHSCSIPAGGGSMASFSINAASGELHITHRWNCPDKSNWFDKSFEATGTAKLRCSSSRTKVRQQRKQGEADDSSRSIRCEPTTLQVPIRQLEHRNGPWKKGTIYFL
ncbi:hypothetical protein RJ55_02186 [Drechmeria coniospora]|nr:hypothetical protein RJ55_02186 [Drechmeria coniospora]